MTADANRAEALTCLDRAREALRMGDHAKAKRMLQKAKSLDPKQDVSFLLKKAETMSGGAETSSNDTADDRSYAHDDHYEDTNNLRSRKAHKSPSRGNTANGTTSKETKPRSASRTPKLGVDYTKEQLELVERIRHCKDYYEILRVTKTASDAEIKKEYRKMALQLHPDKCRAPHATEAFKALGNAYAILADADKRRQYDTYGADAPTTHSHQPSRRHRGEFFEYDYAHGFDSDFTPEEIFNMFFGGGFPSEQVRRRHRQQHAQREEFNHNHNQNEHPYAPLLQLLPLIAILVLGLVAQIMVADPAFSLHQTQKYPVKRMTAEMKVPYYVRADFEQSYQGRIKSVENQVEDEYLQNLRMNCYKEQNQRETLLYRARWQRDEDLIRRAERMAMPNCDRLREIYGR